LLSVLFCLGFRLVSSFSHSSASVFQFPELCRNCDVIQRGDGFAFRFLPDVRVVRQHFTANVSSNRHDGLFTRVHQLSKLRNRVVSQRALSAPAEERVNFAVFSPYLEISAIPVPTEVVEGVVDMRRQYSKAKSDSFKRFSEAAGQLEGFMRQHVSGESKSAD
jgi:hypothetical protein